MSSSSVAFGGLTFWTEGRDRDRDLNAARNIYNIGMANYSESKPVESQNFDAEKQESTSKLRFA